MYGLLASTSNEMQTNAGNVPDPSARTIWDLRTWAVGLGSDTPVISFPGRLDVSRGKNQLKPISV